MNAYEMSKLLDVSARPEVIGLNDVRGAFVLTASPAIQLELALHLHDLACLTTEAGRR